MGLGTKIKSFFGWVGKGFKEVWDFIVQNTDWDQFFNSVSGVALMLIENAAKMDLNNDGKKGYVKEEIIAYCKEQGIIWKEHFVELIIQVMYTFYKAGGKLEK